MTAKELRDLRDDELVEQIKTARKDVFGLRFQLATGELENTAGVDEELAREAMRLAGHKLPVRTKFVMREDAGQ